MRYFLSLKELFGWYGMIVIVTAYLLVSFSILSPTSVWYQVLNGTGALGIVVVSFSKRAWQSGILNIIWTFIAMIALLKILF